MIDFKIVKQIYFSMKHYIPFLQDLNRHWWVSGQNIIFAETEL